MNVLVVYFSKFGNTAKVAEIIADVMQTAGTVQCLSLNEMNSSDLEGCDLLIMGTPTHRMNLPEPVREVLQSTPKGILRGKPVAAFDTSYKMSWFLSQFTASKRLVQSLRKLGGKRIIPPETFHVIGREGPLYQGEIERARYWARSILETAIERRTKPQLKRSLS